MTIDRADDAPSGELPCPGVRERSRLGHVSPNMLRHSCSYCSRQHRRRVIIEIRRTQPDRHERTLVREPLGLRLTPVLIVPDRFNLRRDDDAANNRSNSNNTEELEILAKISAIWCGHCVCRACVDLLPVDRSDRAAASYNDATAATSGKLRRHTAPLCELRPLCESAYNGLTKNIC